MREKPERLALGSARTKTPKVPIWISKRTLRMLLLGVLVALVLLIWAFPSVLVMMLGVLVLASVILLFDFVRVRLRRKEPVT